MDIERTSEVYKAAVEALTKLFEADDQGRGRRVDDAFSEVVGESRFAGYASHGPTMKRRPHHVCTDRLIHRKEKCADTPDKPCFSPRALPASDHLSEWHVGGETVSIVSQPYYLGLESMRKIVAYADEHNLDVRLNASKSWHFPGQTLFLEWTRKEE